MTDARIIDADGHFVEPDATFRDFLPAKYASYAPRVIQYDDHFRIAVNDNISYRMMAKVDTLGRAGPDGQAHRCARSMAVGASDPAGRIRDLDLEGFERAVLFPTYGLMVQGVTDRTRGSGAVPRHQRVARRVLPSRPVPTDRRRDACR